MLANLRKRLEVTMTISSEEKKFSLTLGRFSDKIVEIVKKKHFFSGSNLKNLFHRKVVFRCIEQFL